MFKKITAGAPNCLILMDFMRRSHMDLEAMTSHWVDEEDLSSPYSTDNPMSLFFQTGYLTIGEWDGGNGYRLRVPNQEVHTAIAKLFVPEYSGMSPSMVSNEINSLRSAIYNGDAESINFSSALRTIDGWRIE